MSNVTVVREVYGLANAVIDMLAGKLADDILVDGGFSAFQ